MDIFSTLAAAVVGTSTVMIGGIVLASRLSKRVRAMLWGK